MLSMKIGISGKHQKVEPHLILGTLANKGFLLQVGLVLDNQSHNPDNPGTYLRTRLFQRKPSGATQYTSSK